ncbi:Histone-lysine N-methyltransferase setd2 [Dermatophagoides farinae]|uniref:[histone H3]-lysine(36) N-trimethyltransferase n=1 Tax=Dermatophagoides farinae TaxID=6954 RepID=A0A922HSE3_DERFA|nr:Histone-lysine N-methyltransferase setd2 [Dermatophagoides farinae]
MSSKSTTTTVKSKNMIITNHTNGENMTNGELELKYIYDDSTATMNGDSTVVNVNHTSDHTEIVIETSNLTTDNNNSVHSINGEMINSNNINNSNNNNNSTFKYKNRIMKDYANDNSQESSSSEPNTTTTTTTTTMVMMNGSTTLDNHHDDESYDINFVSSEVDVCSSNLEISTQDEKNESKKSPSSTPNRRGRKPKNQKNNNTSKAKKTDDNKKTKKKDNKNEPVVTKSSTRRRSTRIKNLGKQNSPEMDEKQSQQQSNGHDHHNSEVDNNNDHTYTPAMSDNTESKKESLKNSDQQTIKSSSSSNKKSKHKSKSSKKDEKSKKHRKVKSKHKSSNDVENHHHHHHHNHINSQHESKSLSNHQQSPLATPKENFTTTLPQQEPNNNVDGGSTNAQTKDSLPSSSTIIECINDNNKQGPEKVKSRWRRNSELEITSTTLSPMDSTPSSPTGQQHSTINSSQESLNPIMIADSPMPSYQQIDENIFLFEKKKCKTKKETKKMVCDCLLMKEERARGLMGCGEDCLNRMLMIECGSRCPLGEHCSNKRFQKKQYMKLTPFKTEKKGWGLMTLESIPANSFIMEYVGEVIDPFMFHKRTDKYSKLKMEHYYFMALKSDEIIDATYKGNMTRFINHSCEPNSITQKWTVNGELRIGFFTIKPVAAGEEITFDYQFQRYGKKAQKCYCESKCCRGYIGSSESGREILTDGSKIPKSKKKVASKKIAEDEEVGVSADEVDEEDEENVEKSEEEEDEDKEAFLEDVALEIDMLAENGGLRNRQQILEVSRLMLRADKCSLRIQLIDIIMSTVELAYLRLFIDYHGLRIIWGWMIEAENVELKARLLALLEVLPIPHKTMLVDCKVLEVVERWAAIDSPESQQYLNIGEQDKKSETPKATDDQSSQTAVEETKDAATVESPKEETNSQSPSINKETVTDSQKSKLITDLSKLSGKIVIKSKTKSSDTTNSTANETKAKSNVTIGFLAQKLLIHWKDLKEGFRIPRLDRQKRHDDEAEADRRSKEEEERRSQGLPFINHDKRSFSDDDDNMEGDSYNTIAGILGNKRRCLKNLTNRRSSMRQQQQQQHRSLYGQNNNISIPSPFHQTPNQGSTSPKLTKEEHRKRFEYTIVQHDYTEALNKYREHLKLYKEALQNSVSGTASSGTNDLISANAAANPMIGFNEFYQQYLTTFASNNPMFMNPDLSFSNNNAGTNEVGTNVQNLLQFGATFDHVQQQFQQQQSVSYLPDTQQEQPVQELMDSNYVQSIHSYDYDEIVDFQDLLPKYESPLIQLVGSNDDNVNENSSYQSLFNIGYKQQDIPPEAIDNVDFNQIKFENDDCLESMEKRMFDEIYPPAGIFFVTNDSKTYYFPIPDELSQGINVKENITEPLPISFTTNTPDQKNLSYDWKSTSINNNHYYYYNRRKQIKQWHPPQDNQIDNYYGDIIISSDLPSCDISHPSTSSSPNSLINTTKDVPIGGTTEMPADELKRKESRRSREHFRYKVSQFIVKCLNPYMRSSCTKGRITNSSHFKSLARKLTHTIVEKELKQVKSSKDLSFTDTVKHKTKDFIKRHMSQFGPIYKPETSSRSVGMDLQDSSSPIAPQPSPIT